MWESEGNDSGKNGDVVSKVLSVLTVCAPDALMVVNKI
jgi:hypothetical protein